MRVSGSVLSGRYGWSFFAARIFANGRASLRTRRRSASRTVFLRHVDPRAEHRVAGCDANVEARVRSVLAERRHPRRHDVLNGVLSLLNRMSRASRKMHCPRIDVRVPRVERNRRRPVPATRSSQRRLDHPRRTSALFSAIPRRDRCSSSACAASAACAPRIDRLSLATARFLPHLREDRIPRLRLAPRQSRVRSALAGAAALSRTAASNAARAVGDVHRAAVRRDDSAIGVETTGLRAAKYSSVLVGEIDAVARLIANGIRLRRRRPAVRAARRTASASCNARSATLRQALRIDLTKGPARNDIPSGRRRASLAIILVFQPFVDDAGIREHRTAQHRDDPAANPVAAANRSSSTPLGSQWSFAPSPLRWLKERAATGEDRIGTFEQRGLAFAHAGRCEIEVGEIVHRVVNDRRRRKRSGRAPTSSACRATRRSFAPRTRSRTVARACSSTSGKTPPAPA